VIKQQQATRQQQQLMMTRKEKKKRMYRRLLRRARKIPKVHLCTWHAEVREPSDTVSFAAPDLQQLIREYSQKSEVWSIEELRERFLSNPSML